MNIIAVTKSNLPIRYQTDRNGTAKEAEKKSEFGQIEQQQKNHKTKFIHLDCELSANFAQNVKVLKCKQTRLCMFVCVYVRW